MPIPSRTEDVPRTPEELYERLTVKDSAIGALWRHQSHALEVYFEGHRDQPDVALEFPTGSGKTLVGLLIADWRRRTTGASSAFVCPTKQLAAQAHEKALGYGVPTVLLVGSSRGWNEADRTRGLGAGATIITTYSHIFNVRPRINATTLVLDDAHAGESYVSQHWSLRLSRTHPGYRAAVEMLKDVLEDGRADALLDDSLSPAARGVPSFVGPAALAPIAPSLVEVLEATVDEGEDASYALFTLRDSLAACACYVAWNELCIRPVVPPTKFHSAFAGAAQRVYLSATLGDAGELERSFGLTRIPRIAMPAEWERHGSGRRLVLLPGAGMPLAEAGAFVETTIRELPRALILVPSDAQLDDGAAFAPDDWDVLRRDDVDAALEPFRSSSESVLVLANRYDGMDLPGDDCRLILMFGLPSGTNLQERFLFETLHADAALRERIRTRIVQGMGRATRSRTDRALVIIAGSPLVDFLRDPGNRAGLRPEVQAEIAYGLYLAVEQEPLAPVVESFLAVDEEWAEAEAYLRQEAQSASIESPLGAFELQASAAHEIRACRSAWRGEMGEASMHAQAAVRSLNAAAVAEYRLFWKVLAAHWAAEHARAVDDSLSARVAFELARDANAASRIGGWRPGLPQVAVPTDAVEVGSRAVRIADRLIAMARSPRLDRYVGELEQDISKDESASFENGLRRLGEMLGYEAVRPGETTAPDGAWRDGDAQFLWEAKSEQMEDGAISPKLVRQANTHPTWVARELGWTDATAVTTFLVTPRTAMQSDARAVADERLHLCTVEAVREVAAHVAEWWRALAAATAGVTAVEVAAAIGRELAERGWESNNLANAFKASPIAV